MKFLKRLALYILTVSNRRDIFNKISPPPPLFQRGVIIPPFYDKGRWGGIL
jgi:hypothetical protein